MTIRANKVVTSYRKPLFICFMTSLLSYGPDPYGLWFLGEWPPGNNLTFMLIKHKFNTTHQELMKNFGTSLMKLSGLTDPVSMMGDQSASLPWPILIASSLNKHGNS